MRLQTTTTGTCPEPDKLPAADLARAKLKNLYAAAHDL
jgi:hypothetical protein